MPGALERLNRIGKTGRFIVLNNGLDLLLIFEQSAIKGGAKILAFDLIKGRQAKGSSPVMQERVSHQSLTVKLGGIIHQKGPAVQG